ncbi:hypothetical protein E2C01_041760 [Portunus trituberculatus]|uniref:Uncharacterized protein n=1 Tax=Portunus trituberculatus TaxID=210409 RepID=A0A5B7FRK3_PORTR|nr:hypothetical protein [Portunus trituberculatus]
MLILPRTPLPFNTVSELATTDISAYVIKGSLIDHAIKCKKDTQIEGYTRWDAKRTMTYIPRTMTYVKLSYDTHKDDERHTKENGIKQNFQIFLVYYNICYAYDAE